MERIESLNYLPPSEIAKTFQKDCSKYIKLLGGKRPMFRGMETQYSEPQNFTSKVFIGRKKVRKNRKAMATNKTAYELVNKWLDKKGWPRRDQSIMMTTNADTAIMFGNEYYVFPINSSYGYAWVEDEDFNNYGNAEPMDRQPKYWGIGKFENFAKTKPEMAEQMLEDFIHGNKHFDIAYNRGNETWMDCNYYYFLYLRGMKKDIQREFREEFKRVGIKL